MRLFPIFHYFAYCRETDEPFAPDVLTNVGDLSAVQCDYLTDYRKSQTASVTVCRSHVRPEKGLEYLVDMLRRDTVIGYCYLNMIRFA